MLQADPQEPVADLHADADAINREDADAAAALFLDVARIVEEGVRYPSVRAVLDYLVGERAHIDLSDYHIRGQQVTCIYHETSELDPVVAYPRSRRQRDFTFGLNPIATLSIY